MKDRVFGIAMLVLAILVFVNGIKEYIFLKTEETVLWSTYGMAYGGIILGILIGVVAVGILRKK